MLTDKSIRRVNYYKSLHGTINFKGGKPVASL